MRAFCGPSLPARNSGVSCAPLRVFENQRRQINDRQELDLIVLSKEAEVERRNELRWLLNWEMTQMNLDLQISSLESQITEYARQTERNANQLEQAVRQRQILQTQITNNQGAIARANDTITELQLRQTDLYQRRRAVDREQLCGIENQLALIGDTADHPFTPLLAGEQPCQTVTPAFTRNQYVAQMCGPDGQSGLRAQLLNSQTQAKAFLMKCVIGSADFADVEPLIADQQMITSNISLPQELANGDCGSFSQTETDFAKKLYEAERDLYAKRKADLEEARDQVDGQLSEVIAWFVAFNGTTQAAQVIPPTCSWTRSGGAGDTVSASGWVLACRSRVIAMSLEGFDGRPGAGGQVAGLPGVEDAVRRPCVAPQVPGAARREGLDQGRGLGATV